MPDTLMSSRNGEKQHVASEFISIVANKYATNYATEIDNNTNAPGRDERWRWRGHIKKSRAGERNTAQKSSYIGYAGRK